MSRQVLSAAFARTALSGSPAAAAATRLPASSAISTTCWRRNPTPSSLPTTTARSFERGCARGGGGGGSCGGRCPSCSVRGGAYGSARFFSTRMAGFEDSDSLEDQVLESVATRVTTASYCRLPHELSEVETDDEGDDGSEANLSSSSGGGGGAGDDDNARRGGGSLPMGGMPAGFSGDDNVRLPTDKQVAFATKLAEENATTVPAEAMESMSAMSDYISDLLDRQREQRLSSASASPSSPGHAASASPLDPATGDPATEKQVAFVRRLCAQKAVPVAAVAAWRMATKRDCSALITDLLEGNLQDVVGGASAPSTAPDDALASGGAGGGGAGGVVMGGVGGGGGAPMSGSSSWMSGTASQQQGQERHYSSSSSSNSSSSVATAGGDGASLHGGDAMIGSSVNPLQPLRLPSKAQVEFMVRIAQGAYKNGQQAMGASFRGLPAEVLVDRAAASLWIDEHKALLNSGQQPQHSFAAAAAAAATGQNRSSSMFSTFGGGGDGGDGGSLPPSPSSLFALGPSPSLAKEGMFADEAGSESSDAVHEISHVLAPWESPFEVGTEQQQQEEEHMGHDTEVVEHLGRLSSSASSASSASKALEDDEKAAKLRHAIASVPF